MTRTVRIFIRILVAVAALAAVGGATAAPVTYTSGNLATAIPDAATLESSITIPDSLEILDVKVSVNIGHPTDDQVNVDLVHPDGTVVRLAHDHGGTGNNYGSGSDCAGGFTDFTDAGPLAIGAGTPPFVGSYRPDSPLSALKGKLGAGAWKLVVRDDTLGAVGTLWCWKLTITYAAADLRLAVIDSPDPIVVGEQITYTNILTNAGPDPSSNTKLTVTLPAGVAFVSAQATNGTCGGATTVICDFGTVPPATSVTLTLIGEVTLEGELVYQATASGTPDPPGLTADNSAGATTIATPGIPSARECTIVGTSGDDVLAGTDGPDVICALGGDDRVIAGGGNDVVYGDGGNDVVLGGDGADTLLGGKGDDRLVGGNGNDLVQGGIGDDRVVGESGADYLKGGAGADVLNGGDGPDVLLARGDGSRDVVRGGPGKDSALLDLGQDVRRSVERLLKKAPPPR